MLHQLGRAIQYILSAEEHDQEELYQGFLRLLIFSDFYILFQARQVDMDLHANIEYKYLRIVSLLANLHDKLVL